MSTGPVKVLLVGRSAKGCSLLVERLEKRGCECCLSTSSTEAARLSGGHGFDLVLCTGQVDGINALIASLIGSTTTLFRSFPVEDNCWWLCAVRRGEVCVSAPALRPSEFAVVLERLVDEIKSDKHPISESTTVATPSEISA